MREGLLVVACIALLMAAAGLLLWQWAKRRQVRQATDRHLSQQILATGAATTIPMPVRDLPGESATSTLTTDPWLESEAATAAAVPSSMLERAFPAWLAGVVEPRTVALALTAIVGICLLIGA